jgi:hypothetical protein
MNHDVRARGQLPKIILVVLGVLFTLGTAAANIIPFGQRPTAAAIRAEEQAEIVAQRKARLVDLRARAGECAPAMAHELAKLLVMDGQIYEARAFAAVYQWRCGADRVVGNWSKAPIPRPRPAR